MKKYLLLLIVNLLFQIVKAQINFQDFKINLSVGLNTNGPNRILDFEKKKLLVFGSELALLDTGTGKFSSLFFPLNTNSTYIQDAGIDSSGKLLLLFNNALYEFDGQKWDIHYLNISNANFIYFMVDSANIVHCILDSVYGYSDHQWNGKNWKFFPINNIKPFNEYINQCLPGPHNDSRLFTSKNRILSFSGSGYILKDSIKSPVSAYSVAYDKSGNLWYAIADTLIKQDSLGNKTIFNSSNSPFINYPYLPVYINSAGNKLEYFNANNYEFYQYNDTTWSLLATFNDFYASAFFESNNEVWFYDNHQLFVYKDKLLKTYDNLIYTLSGFKPTCVFNLQNGTPGDIWVGTETGIYDFYFNNYSPQTGFNFRIIDSSNCALTNNHINSIEDISNKFYFHIAYPDTIFVGTNNGLFIGQYNDSLTFFKHYTTANSPLPCDTINSLKFFYNYSGGKSELWIGTNKGCAQLNLSTATWTVYDTGNSVLPSNKINNITWQPNTLSVYICTDSGFVQVTDTVLKAFTMANSALPYPDIRWVDEEDFNTANNGKRLWIATMGKGIASYIDTSGYWDYMSKSLGNFPSDSINFLYGNVNYYSAYPYPIIGTKDTGLIIYQQYPGFFSSGYYEMEDFINGTEKNIFAYYENGLDCEGGGWQFIGLTDSGFIMDFECFGGIDDKKPAGSTLNAWFNEQQLNAKWTELKPGKASLALYDLMGRIVMNVTTTADNTQHVEVNAPSLIPGVYLLRITQQGKIGSQLLPYMR